LKWEGFSGTVEIEFPVAKGTLFIVSGEVIDAEARKGEDSKRATGQEAARHLLSLSNQKDGVLHVYRVPRDRVEIMVRALQFEILFKDLSSDFTRLDRLILKLREEKHNGFIEFFSKERKGMGFLFFHDGEIADLFTPSESGVSAADKKSIPVFLENAVKQGVIFNVHRSQGRTPAKEVPPKESAGGGGVKELVLIFQEILSKVEKMVDINSRKGMFLEEFRRSLIEKSDHYPFIDPFAGEFEYREGVMGFTGEAEIKDFVRAVGECLRTTLDHLEGEFIKNKMLVAKLRAAVRSSLEHHKEALKRMGVDGILLSIFQ
jgi:hypothetical protein